MNIASTSFHARRESFDLNCNISSVYLSIFKCNLGETNDEFVTFQSFLSGDTVPNEYKREKKATDYCIHLPDVYSPPPGNRIATTISFSQLWRVLYRTKDKNRLIINCRVFSSDNQKDGIYLLKFVSLRCIMLFDNYIVLYIIIINRYVTNSN